MVYKKLKGQDIRAYMQFYDDHKILTNKLD